MDWRTESWKGRVRAGSPTNMRFGSNRPRSNRARLAPKKQNPARTVSDASGASCNFPGWLEVNLSAELQDSRVEGRGELAKTAIAQGRTHPVELRMVPGVEGFQTQL
jgi:hypothetical protein